MEDISNFIQPCEAYENGHLDGLKKGYQEGYENALKTFSMCKNLINEIKKINKFGNNITIENEEIDKIFMKIGSNSINIQIMYYDNIFTFYLKCSNSLDSTTSSVYSTFDVLLSRLKLELEYLIK